MFGACFFRSPPKLKQQPRSRLGGGHGKIGVVSGVLQAWGPLLSSKVFPDFPLFLKNSSGKRGKRRNISCKPGNFNRAKTQKRFVHLSPIFSVLPTHTNFTRGELRTGRSLERNSLSSLPGDTNAPTHCYGGTGRNSFDDGARFVVSSNVDVYLPEIPKKVLAMWVFARTFPSRYRPVFLSSPRVALLWIGRKGKAGENQRSRSDLL